MSQNFGGEFQIPASNHNPNSQAPIYDELNTIFQNSRETSETPTYRQLEAERVLSPISQELYAIAKSIDEARKDRLGSTFFTYERDENKLALTSLAKKLFGINIANPRRRLVSLSIDQLIEEESIIGASLFGDRPSNEHIKFFKDINSERDDNGCE